MLSFWIFINCLTLVAYGHGENAVLKDAFGDISTSNVSLHYLIKYNMRKSLDLEMDGCYLQVGRKESLQKCGFNATAKTIFIIHGWMMSGGDEMFESWMTELVSAVIQRETEANVVIVDWISMANQLYPDAVNHTKRVGLSIADMLNWLQDEHQLPLSNVHLIGYSLGAHVAGYAGKNVQGTLGRITGLDPAGPMFEGVGEANRLSPDDADFVDVLHTSTREALGVSIGIQQPIGDIDIYPNAGEVQPGCSLGDVLAVAGNDEDDEDDKDEEEIDMTVEHQQQQHKSRRLVNSRQPVTITVCADHLDPRMKRFHISIHQQQHNYAAPSPDTLPDLPRKWARQDGPAHQLLPQPSQNSLGSYLQQPRPGHTASNSASGQYGARSRSPSPDPASSPSAATSSFYEMPSSPPASGSSSPPSQGFSSYSHSRLSSPQSSYCEDTDKRRAHNFVARKRRNNLRSCFLLLRDEIPGLADCPKTPKVAILKRATQYLQQLHAGERQKAQERRQLKARQLQLQRQLAQLRRS